MSPRLQILLLLILTISLLAFLNMVRKKTLELKYILVWIIGNIFLIFFTCFPQVLEQMASFFGFYSAMNMIFFFGFLFALLVIFSLIIALSRVTEKLRCLTQKMALDKKEIDEKFEKVFGKDD